MLTAPLLVALASGLQDAPRTEPPNIVLAIADDLDPDHLGFCGNPLARSPELDRLAQAGVRFSTLYAQPVCRPALATLLSGRWPHQTGILNNELAAKPLDPSGSLAARLAARGYATFCGGKFWEGDHHAYGFSAPAERDATFGRKNGPGQDELFRFLEAERARPWFVWWAPSLPHVPLRPRVRFQRAFETLEVPVPEWFDGPITKYVEVERAVLAMEAWLDAEFASLIRRLTRLGELENTLIVFLADNGWSAALPSKGTACEKGVRSPLFVWLPGGTREPRSVVANVDLVDVYATLLDYAGASADEGSPGRSLRGWLEGGSGPTRELLCGAVYPREGSGRAEADVCALYARDRRWKYVLGLRTAGPDRFSVGGPLAPGWHTRAGEERLFDLENDPLERVDLAADPAHAERLRRLRGGVLDWWRASGGGELTLEPSGR